MHHRANYPSDLTDEEWYLIEPLVPAVNSGGRPADHGRREIVNAIFNVLRTGCQWRFLPHDLPPWKTVYPYFRTWRLDGGGVCQVVEKCLPSSPAVHHKCCSLCGLLLHEGRSKRHVFTTDLAAQLDLPAAQQPEE